MKTLYESILSSTGSGMNAAVLNGFAKYFKDIIDDNGRCTGPGTQDVYIPGEIFTSRLRKRLEYVFKIQFPRSKYRTRTTQVVKILQKAGYKSVYDTNDENYAWGFSLSNVKPFIYYRPLENHLNIYWDNIVFKIGEVNFVFVFVKEPKSAYAVLYVYALNPDDTESKQTIDQIKKLIPQK
jgi:hypothetical protein